MKTLLFLDYLSELIQLVFTLGLYTRKYLVPAVVYVYVGFTYFILPALNIPYYYFKVRAQRLAIS